MEGAVANPPGHVKSDRRHPMHWLHWVLGFAILGGLVVAAAKYLHGAEVLAAIARFNWAHAAPILLLSALYLLLKAWWFGIALRHLTQVPLSVLLRAYVAGQPATLLPGGVAARMGLLAEVGVPASTTSAPVILNSVLDQVSFLVLALVGAAWYPAAQSAALGMAAAVTALVLLLAVPISRRWLRARFASGMLRIGLGKQWGRFEHALSALACWRIMGSGLAITLAAKLLLVVIFELCLNAIGLSAGWPALLLVTTLPTVLGRITPLPGGAGPTEAGMVALLGTTAHIAASPATAAVALFRLATIVFQSLTGAVVYFFFWHAEREPATAEHAAATEQPLHSS
jgi:uncharacterized membrane protein YbhN (UPF0104 family)